MRRENAGLATDLRLALADFRCAEDKNASS